MSNILNRAYETTTTTGTGTINLDGAVTGYNDLVTAATRDIGGSGPWTIYYVIETDSTWEMGTGTLTNGSPDTLSRDTIHASSNSDAAVSFGSGTKRVFAWPPASFIQAPTTLAAKTTDYSIVAGDLGDVIIPVDLNTSGSVDITELALGSMDGRVTVVVVADEGDTGTRKCRLMDSGASEVATLYQVNDYVQCTYDGTTRRVVGERVSVTGEAYLTSDHTLVGDDKIFDANYSVDVDKGNWWDSATNHRLDIAFDCVLHFDLVVRCSQDANPHYLISGTDAFNSAQPGSVAKNQNVLSVTREFAASEYIEFYCYESAGGDTAQGDAGKDETQLFWHVLKRNR